MPFSRPTLSQLIDRDATDFESRLPGVDARLRRSIIGVLTKVHAAAVHGLYGFLDWLSKQLMPDTAEAAHLDRWSTIWKIPRKAAVSARGNITITGVNGTVIPAGTALQRADGVQFTTDVLATIVAGTATVAVTAVVGSASSNTAVSSALAFVSPIPGINSSATVAAGGLAGGVDIESDDALRTRLLDGIRQPPHGGAAADYVTWALEVAGVTRVWAYPAELGLGTVTVRFVRDDDVPIIPDAAEVLAVQNYINARRPVTAAVTVVAPISVALNFTITLTPNTQIAKDAVQASLVDLLRREAQPGGTILLTHIREAISAAAGETNHILTVPAADVVSATGNIPIMGVITWG